MCMQCLTEAKPVRDDESEVLPGYYLYIATKSYDAAGSGWYEGELGLVQMNDPSYIITAKPLPEPPDGDEYTKEDKAFWEQVGILDDDLQGDPMSGYSLVNACKQAGYDPEVDGYRIAAWLLNYLYQYINKPV